jgi:putative SOS response-associated peptidase YedK
MQDIHDRMPVILDPADIGYWLIGWGGAELLRPATEGALRMWPVSKRVNQPGSGGDAGLIEALAWG